MSSMIENIARHMRAEDFAGGIEPGISVFDDEFRLVHFNQKYLEIFDFPPELVRIGCSLEGLIRNVAERGLYGDGNIEQLVQGRLEERRQPGNRRVEWLRECDRVVEMFWRQVPGVGSVTISNDVTERCDQVNALRDSEIQLGDVLDGVPVGVAVTGAGGRFFMANQTLASWAGESPSSIIGKTVHDFQPRAIADEIVDRERHILETGAESTFEATRGFSDGITRTILVHKRRIQLGFAKISAVATSLTDISQRKHSEKALRESEEKFRGLLEGSIQGVLIHDYEKIVFVNRSYAEILGYESSDEILNQGSAYEHVAPEDRARLMEFGAARLRGEPIPELYEFRGLSKNGSVVHLENRGRLVTWNGRPAIQRTIVDVSATRRAQDLLADAVGSFGDGFAVWDANDRLVLCNDALSENLGDTGKLLVAGVEREQVLRSLAHSGLRPNAVGREEEWVRMRMSSADQPGVPFQEKCPNGRWIELRASRTREGGTVIIQRDITETKRAERRITKLNAELERRVDERTRNLSVEIAERESSEAAWRQSEERHRAIIENTAEGIVTINAAGKIENFNPACEKIFGYAASEVLGEDVSMLLPIPERSDHKDYVSNSELHEPRIINQARELFGRGKDGELIPLELNVAPVIIDGTRRFVGIVRDISERKKAEEELRSSQERLSLSQKYANLGTFEHDLEKNELYWSEQLPKLLGLPADDANLSYETICSMIHPDDRERCRIAENASAEVDTDFDVECRVIWPNGTHHWLRSTGHVVPASKKRSARRIGIVRDVTKEKEAAETLRIAREDAEQANTAKSEFLSSMSHELRTPLNAILGFAQLLKCNFDGTLSDDQITEIGQILSSGEHLLGLINEVLDLAKIEAGRTEFNVEAVPVTGIVAECREMIEFEAEQRGIEIVTEIEDDCWVSADRTRFKQVLLNLMSNAVKYNREGGSINLSTATTSRGVLRFRVSDTGIGISKGREEDVFRPFVRLEPKSATATGTGIGLSICRRLVEAMDGTLGFESELGVGSTFWVELPNSTASVATEVADKANQIVDPPIFDDNDLDEQAEKMAKLFANNLNALNSTATILQNDTIPEAVTKKKSVLYIDDDPANVFLMQSIISREKNVDFRSASTGELGLEMAQSSRPDLILLDINLPELNGYEVRNRLRDNVYTKDIPVVGLSANAFSSDIELASAHGFDRYLTKPINIEGTRKILNKYLTKK